MKLTGNTLSILGCVCVFITTYYIYIKAKSNNRNAIRWAFVNLVVGFVFQFALPLLIAITGGLAVAISRGSTRDIDRIYAKYGLITEIIILILNFVGIWLVVRQVSKISNDEVSAVPPPPNFDEKH